MLQKSLQVSWGPRPTPSPSRTFPSHQWRLVRCAPTWYVQIQKQHRCLYNRIHHKVSVWSVGFFCGSTVAAMREIQSVKSPLDTKKSWDVTRIVSFFQHFKIAHLVDRICVCVCANMLRHMWAPGCSQSICGRKFDTVIDSRSSFSKFLQLCFIQARVVLLQDHRGFAGVEVQGAIPVLWLDASDHNHLAFKFGNLLHKTIL